jgi:deazaflavin-dependent oxidoreductase (nitroreductase family)
MRRVPLLYMPDGDAFIVIASNFGQEHPPAWWLNLCARPDAAVQVRGRRIAVAAHELKGQERDAMLRRAAAYNKQWRSYMTSVVRELPIVRLERR